MRTWTAPRQRGIDQSYAYAYHMSWDGGIGDEYIYILYYIIILYIYVIICLYIYMYIIEVCERQDIRVLAMKVAKNPRKTMTQHLQTLNGKLNKDQKTDHKLYTGCGGERNWDDREMGKSRNIKKTRHDKTINSRMHKCQAKRHTDSRKVCPRQRGRVYN